MLGLLAHNRNFTLVWLGQVLSQGGTRLYQIALLWWLLGSLPEDTRGLASGAFLVMGALPPLLLVRHIGRFLDRAPSRAVMLRAELIACGVVTVLAVFASFDAVSPWAVYPVAIVLATTQAFFDPCLLKAMPELVEGKDIERAVGFGSSTQSVANFAGAAVGAAVIAGVGFAGAVWVNAATYAVAALCLLAAKFTPLPTAPGGAAAPASEGSTWSFLGSMPGVRPLLLCFAAANFFSAPTLLVLPLYTKLVLEQGAGTLAVLEAALWLGLLLGAFAAASIPTGDRVTRFGAGCIALFAVCLGVPGLLVNGWLYGVLLAASGVCLGVSNVKFTALFQAVVPNEVKGRFFAALQAAVSLTFPVAFLVFGAVGDAVSPQLLALAQAAGLLVVAATFLKLREPRPVMA
ncbi:MFS family permease [Crossiella equi]|uniref:MFS family permease n=1 Tax=Crossiella equi TaxID=130796 RepID=A0ABS5A425_9PSEU|nr:MFS transporter [Crossiella equi]MBP2471283.1 MFS family permease [Crossiella equi]